MTDEELLTAVKSVLLISGEFHDAMLKIYIAEILDFLKSAGVPAAVLQSEKIVGIVSRGVADLWNYGAGDGKLSPYFYQRATQLTAETGA
jgi:hypothetical protein